MTPARAAAYFTRADGAYRFARWGRAPAPVVFGTDDASLGVIKDAIRSVAALGNLPLAETDPELGANLLLFFCADWSEIGAVPGLERLIDDLAGLTRRLERAEANQYRSFRFDADGAIKLCIILLRYDAGLRAVSAQTLATAQMVQSMLLWSDTAFAGASPVALLRDGAHCVARPEVAALIRAAYDPVLPAATEDPAHAHRLAARASLLLKDLAHDP